MPATNDVTDVDAGYAGYPSSETYIPWFPPCQPCGHCPSCGRGGLPLRWPYWHYVGDYPGYTFTTIGQSESNYTLYNAAA